ncbi:MAG: MATE family efflux transporter [Alphaproteobacteria bacterium]
MIFSTVSFADVWVKMKEMFKPSLIIAFAYLAQSIIVTTDVLIISWLGVDELASSGFVVRFYMPFFLLALGFSLPILAMGGKAKGTGSNKGVRSVVQHSLLLNFVVSVFSAFITGYLLNKYLVYIEQPQYIIDYANDYADIFLWSIPLVVWGSSMRSFMTVAGDASLFMRVGFVMAGLNAVLDYVLVFGLDGFVNPMGIAGAAIATIIVNLIYLLIMGYFIINNAPFSQYEIFTKFEKIKLKMFKDITVMGFPMSIRMITESGLMTYYYTLMAGFGAIYLAGYQVAYQLDTLAFLFAIGTATMITTNVGIANGKRNVKDMLSNAYAGTLLMTGSLTIIGLILFVFAPFISFIFFGGNADYETIKPVAINMIIIVAIYQAVHSLYFAILSAIDGMGKTKISSTLFIIVLIVVGAGGSYVLKDTFLGGYGILIACFVAYAVSFFVLFPLFIKFIKDFKEEYDR